MKQSCTESDYWARLPLASEKGLFQQETLPGIEPRTFMAVLQGEARVALVSFQLFPEHRLMRTL